MEVSLKTGFMAVFAVSGSVVFLAMQAHKRLVSDFIDKFELEIITSTGVVKDEPKKKKKVRFADDEVESMAKTDYRKNHLPGPAAGACRKNDEQFEDMPENWQVLYKGILKHRRDITI